MSHSSIGGQFIFIDIVAVKSNDHHFEKIFFQVFEDLQAITVPKPDDGFMPIRSLGDLQTGYTFFQGLKQEAQIRPG